MQKYTFIKRTTLFNNILPLTFWGITRERGASCNTLILNTSTHASTMKFGVFTSCHFNTI